MTDTNPKALARRQLETDRERTRRFPDLFAQKLARMTASPFSFLRGSAPLFYEIARGSGALGDGPPGDGWIVGDAHLENFGAISVESDADEDRDRRKWVDFNLNDFDEAVRGPWRCDVLRLATSVILAGRELSIDGVAALELAEMLIESYASTAFEPAKTLAPPPAVSKLLERVGKRSRKELLDDRTAVQGDRRRFVRGSRYRDLAPDIAKQVPAAFASYAAGLRPRPNAEQMEIVDLAFRIAGTGGLGVLRIAVLTRGKGGADGCWIFDMKEQLAHSAYGPNESDSSVSAERVALGFRTCLEHPPRLLGTARLGDIGLLVRRFAPQEDKLNLSKLEPDALAPLVVYLGALLAGAHRRGSSGLRNPWRKEDHIDLLERSATLAGLHEAIFLEFCLLSRGLR